MMYFQGYHTYYKGRLPTNFMSKLYDDENSLVDMFTCVIRCNTID